MQALFASLVPIQKRCSVKKVFLEILQNSQKKTYARASFLIKLQAWGLQLYQKKRLWHWCFLGNVAKFLRILFLIEHLWWLLLSIVVHFIQKNYLKMLSWILLVFKAVKGYLYMKAIWNSSLWCSPPNRSENILKHEYEKVIHKIKWYVKYLLFNFSPNRDSMRCVLFWISMRCILVWILQSFSQEFLCRTL